MIFVDEGLGILFPVLRLCRCGSVLLAPSVDTVKTWFEDTEVRTGSEACAFLAPRPMAAAGNFYTAAEPA